MPQHSIEPSRHAENTLRRRFDRVKAAPHPIAVTDRAIVEQWSGPKRQRVVRRIFQIEQELVAAHMEWRVSARVRPCREQQLLYSGSSHKDSWTI